MKKIDLHIHTKATVSDSNFIFSLAKLQEYIENAQLDAIAITNHNIFDAKQFETIKDGIKIKAFPGIEINLEQGHTLLISDGDDLIGFSSKCEQISEKIGAASDYISVSELKGIFGNLGNYLIIPHYEKSPKLSSNTLAELKDFITAGEVNSPKKFIRAKKDESSLVPAYFSDVRISDNLEKFPTRQTFIDCAEVNLKSLKTCFNDKEKVALSEHDGNGLFQIFDNGQKLSTGLNVVLGERSSGKTHTLNRINNELGGAKYIRQFSLAQDDITNEDKFNELLSNQHSLITEEYLKEFKIVLNDVISIDLKRNDRELSEYLESLHTSAAEVERRDAYSNAALYDEGEFEVANYKGLDELIGSVIHLIENIAYKNIIEKHLDKENLKRLVLELIGTFRKKHFSEKKERFVNEIVREIKKGLHLRSSATQIKNIDLYRHKVEQHKINRFIEITANLQAESIIHQEAVQGFKVVANKRKFIGAGEIKKVSGQMIAFKEAFQRYSKPYEYLQELKNNEPLNESEFYKFFAKIEYKILNKDGFEVSGGERSEFRLLHEIKDAQNYDYLLIDEPESSFDNPFLRTEVNKIIKEISKNMPVVVVTHNSTVGVSIKPDYLLYTSKEVENGKVKYQIYSGYPTDKELLSRDGTKKANFELTINSLEAGYEAYKERKKTYDNLNE